MVPLGDLWGYTGSWSIDHHHHCDRMPAVGKVSMLSVSAIHIVIVPYSLARFAYDCMQHSRWYRARHGSLMVAAASAGAAAVRKADPVHYPPAPHAYFRLGEHELSAPLLCAVCFERVEPNNLFQVITLNLAEGFTKGLCAMPRAPTFHKQAAWDYQSLQCAHT